MADQIARPSLDPANNDSLAGLLREAFGKLLQTVDGMLPAVVMSYDRTAGRAQVRPMVRLLATDGQTVSRAAVASIPVLQLGGGGYMLDYPLQPGDLGWILAGDRDISMFLQGYAESAPNTVRTHSFSDGLFIPHLMKDRVIAPEDARNAVWQAVDSTTRLSLWTDYVKATAPQGLYVTDAESMPHDDCVFQVESMLKASKPWPSMTQAERDAIPDPQTGMVVWLMPDERQSVYAFGAWS